MYKKIKFSASAMCFDWLNVEKQISEIERLNIDYIHYITRNFIPILQWVHQFKFLMKRNKITFIIIYMMNLEEYLTH